MGKRTSFGDGPRKANVCCGKNRIAPPRNQVIPSKEKGLSDPCTCPLMVIFGKVHTNPLMGHLGAIASFGTNVAGGPVCFLALSGQQESLDAWLCRLVFSLEFG